MAQKKDTVTLRIRLAWWFMPYVRVLIFFCYLHQAWPDEEKLRKMIGRAIRIKAV